MGWPPGWNELFALRNQSGSGGTAWPSFSASAR